MQQKNIEVYFFLFLLRTKFVDQSAFIVVRYFQIKFFLFFILVAKVHLNLRPIVTTTSYTLSEIFQVVAVVVQIQSLQWRSSSCAEIGQACL